MDSVSHYRIEERLGAGGMGVVYRGFDTRLERAVALKFVPDAGAEARARLLREARAAAALNHPHICVVYEVGEDGGRVFIAMEYVEGRPLSNLARGQGLPVEAVLRYGVQMADALAHAHQRGVVHRDLKSANVMITPEGRVKVLDFGLAVLLPPDGLEEATRSQLVEAGVAGTLHYMAPEVLRGEPADMRSDVWSLGVLLYEMIAGQLPFQGRTMFELSAAILRETPAAMPGHPPPGLETTLRRCLAKETGRRYQQAGEVRAALEAVQAGASRADSKPGAAARILLVEDEPSLVLGLEEDLKLEGYEVEVAGDGETAKQRALSQPFDLILLDVTLPRKDGFEVCREVRRAGLRTPIILLTGRAQEAEKVLGLELGADDYVTKPYSPRELRARVKAALRRAG